MQAPIVKHTKKQIYMQSIHPFTHNATISPNVHIPPVAQHIQCPALTPSAASKGQSIFSPLPFFYLSDYEEQQQQLQPLSLLVLSRGKAVGLAGEADLWRWR